VLRSLALLLALLTLLLVACGGDDDPPEPSEKPAAQSQDQGQDEPTESDSSGCQEVAAPEPKPDGGAKKPAKPLAAGPTYEVVMKTSCGAFTIRLDQKVSPKTTSSFASLVRSGFYDDTVFHRIVPDFVIQGGDPTGTGTGGPGYSTRDVPPGDTVYTEGVVAMAKTAVEPPGTSGSQFYVVTAPDAGLPPEYAVLGRVVKGQEVVAAIGLLGDPASGGAGTPLQPVVLESAKLVTKG
jgi:peptidyl-prolyl cis-trans isomerase B (cyclophilin B)